MKIFKHRVEGCSSNHIKISTNLVELNPNKSLTLGKVRDVRDHELIPLYFFARFSLPLQGHGIGPSLEKWGCLEAYNMTSYHRYSSPFAFIIAIPRQKCRICVQRTSGYWSL